MGARILLVALIVFLSMSDEASAEIRECQAIKALRPQADAIREAVRKLSSTGTDSGNCQRARQILADYRSLLRQTGERCLPERINENILTAEPRLFDSSGWEGSIESVVLACENEGVLPPRVSQSACSAQADFENEYAKLLREAIKLRNAERTSVVCRDAAAVSRKIEIMQRSWIGIEKKCQNAGTPVYYTEWPMYDPVRRLCEQTTPTASDDNTVLRDWFSGWFSGYRGVIIIPVGLIVVGLIWLFRLLARG